MIMETARMLEMSIGGIGTLILVLLGWIIHELRSLRLEIKGCVPDNMCRIMMKAHEDRIEKLENIHSPTK